MLRCQGSLSFFHNIDNHELFSHGHLLLLTTFDCLVWLILGSVWQSHARIAHDGLRWRILESRMSINKNYSQNPSKIEQPKLLWYVVVKRIWEAVNYKGEMFCSEIALLHLHTAAICRLILWCQIISWFTTWTMEFYNIQTWWICSY